MLRRLLGALALAASLGLSACSEDLLVVDLRARAEGGEAESQYRLGVLHRSDRYDTSRGSSVSRDAYFGFLPQDIGDLWVPPDDEAAERWLVRAAEQGHAHAQVQLAGLLMKEDRNPTSPLMAYVWLSRAAKRIETRRREEVLDLRLRVQYELNAYQRDEARRLVRVWVPTRE